MAFITRVTAGIQSRLDRHDHGASLVEYALLVSLIAIVAVIAITTFGAELSNEFDSIAAEIP